MLLSASSTIRRTGVALALAAVILLLAGWLLLLQPTDGANIGAGLVLLFAEVVAVAATVVLLCSLGRARRDDYGVGRRRWTGLDLPGKLGALLGVCYLLIWVAELVLINFPIDPTQLEIAGVASFVAGAVLMSASRT